MNYLAHLSLSFKNDDLMLGNLVADFTRKAKFSDFSSEVQRGIQLHHFIDDYTDSHSLVEEAKAIIRPQQGKFSGVVMDIYFDHLLARDYHFWHQESLADFAQNAYQLFNLRKDELPEATVHMLHYMERGNWLLNYASLEGLQRSLKGMSSRTKYPNNMDQASHQLQRVKGQIMPLFSDFYKELVHAVNAWIAKN
jgi:acyl carrier protein phosphodiesterase